MTVNSKPIYSMEGKLLLTRSATAEEFHCGRCNTDKKAKLKATRTTAAGEDVICNGCYGNILSKEGVY